MVTLTIGYASASGFNVLGTIKNCTCLRYNQTYECRVTGRGATVWTGSAFICENEIVLLHAESFTEKTCNNGAISGRIIRAENDTYISQLTVSVSTHMIGTNISCSHDSTSGVNLISSSLIALTLGGKI